MRLRALITVPSLALFLAGCGGAPAGNEMQIDNDGGGKFSGHAGKDWSEQDIRKMVASDICKGADPRQFTPQVVSGSTVFSGSC